VDDVRVVAGLVARELRLALDDGDGTPGAGHRVRGGEADDAAADHDDVERGGTHEWGSR
jgi:hypothetical protein